MTTNVAFNPYVTTVSGGLFNTTSTGLRQGTAYPEPGLRWQRRTGVLAAAETLPMWGGIGIYELVPNPTSSNGVVSQGPAVGRASALTGSKALAGFSVFDGANAMITSPQSTVPIIGSGGQVVSYRLGSGMRLAVAADPALVAILQGNPIGTAVSWDFVNQLLIPFVGTLTISSGTYVSGTGVVTLTMSAPITFSPGDAIVVSGLTGTGAFASLNGTFTALAGTTGSTVVYNAGAGLGAATITGGSLTLGSGASVQLPCTVLDIQSGNCETVIYNPTTQAATWNYNGTAAVIQI